ncbi:hypothetical protein JCM8547_000934 [Rhodosporidiobolus lusitaniae]
MIWSVHKWTCGKEDEPLSFPPLSTEELAALEKIKNLHCIGGKTYQPHPSLMHYLRASGLFTGSWEDLFLILQRTSPNPSIPWVEAALFSQVHTHLHRWSEEGRLINLPQTPWREVFSIFTYFRVGTNSLTDATRPAAFRELTPVFHQILVHFALHCTKSPTSQDLHELAVRRFGDVLSRCAVANDVKQGIRIGVFVRSSGKFAQFGV